ncbi:hypothetical protein TorRG33x02_356010 [Trema orientale]|uniref:Uncharacterized protein n=1 Tax=Trema orientale TaxID=63057 RepID=A0A2P5A813_TREOI|nr:hypothetical protein TorRG33x02_356010 [Trema orientale]
MLDEIRVVVHCVLDGANLPLAGRGPPGLADNEVYAAVADGLGGDVDSIEQLIEHVGVGDAGGRVMDATVGLEEGVVRVFGIVAEVGIRVDHEWRVGFGEELQHWCEDHLVVASPEPGGAWWFRD